MDLGRPVARHTIRRPHEVIDLEAEVQRETPAADNDQQQQVSSDTPER